MLKYDHHCPVSPSLSLCTVDGDISLLFSVGDSGSDSGILANGLARDKSMCWTSQRTPFCILPVRSSSSFIYRTSTKDHTALI